METNKSPTQIRGTALVVESTVWYKDQYRRSLMAAFYLSIAMIGALTIIAVLLLVRPKPAYFAVSSDLRVVQLTPLNEPLVEDQGIIDWSAKVVESTMGFDFVHWKSTLESVRGDYTPNAFNQFVGRLKSTGILQNVLDRRLVLSAAPISSPIIVNKGPLGGSYAWEVKFPMIISYQSNQGVTSSNNVTVTLMIKRQNTVEYPRGIAIDELVIQQESQIDAR